MLIPAARNLSVGENLVVKTSGSTVVSVSFEVGLDNVSERANADFCLEPAGRPTGRFWTSPELAEIFSFEPLKEPDASRR